MAKSAHGDEDNDNNDDDKEDDNDNDNNNDDNGDDNDNAAAVLLRPICLILLNNDDDATAMRDEDKGGGVLTAPPPIFPQQEKKTRGTTSTLIWGNTSCREFHVGMVLYHFPEDADDPKNSGCGAYASYESPGTEMWPVLDNGNAVPSRGALPQCAAGQGHEGHLGGEMRRERKCSTVWTGKLTRLYKARFDPMYAFVGSGTATCLPRGGNPTGSGRTLCT